MATVFGYDDPGTHAWMVLDTRRTEAFGAAIAAVVRPGDVVLDIGSGSGILALFAARAGARKVYAVEASDAHTLIRAHARENGYESIIDVHGSDLRDLDPALLDPKPTVIVSEMLGQFAPEERMHALYALARRKLAAPDARILPEAYRLCFALARLDRMEADLAQLKDMDGISLGALAERLHSRPTLLRVTADELLTEEVPTEYVRLDATRPDAYAVDVPIARSGEANAIVISFQARLAPGHLLGTRVEDPKTHWEQCVLPLGPSLRVEAGQSARLEVRPRLVSDRGSWAWRAQIGEQEVGGDAMDAMVGGNDLAGVAKRLGFRLKDPESFQWTGTLLAWEALLAGGLDGQTVSSLAVRLHRALPDRYADESDARQEVMDLLRTAHAF